MRADRPSRRELLRPVQLLGLAFAAAIFAGLVTLLTTGVFQDRPVDQVRDGVELALVFAGITFIATLVGIALLMLAVDPAKVVDPDHPVLYPESDDEPGRSDAAEPGASDAADSGSSDAAPGTTARGPSDD